MIDFVICFLWLVEINTELSKMKFKFKFIMKSKDDSKSYDFNS